MIHSIETLPLHCALRFEETLFHCQTQEWVKRWTATLPIYPCTKQVKSLNMRMNYNQSVTSGCVCLHTADSAHRRLLSARPYSQPFRGSWTSTMTVSPLLKGKSFGLDEEGWDTRALMGLPPPKPSDSPTELERERLGRGDGAGESEHKDEIIKLENKKPWRIFATFWGRNVIH